MRCLVVDDSTTMRRILVNTLRTIGIVDVVEAGHGKEALAKWDTGFDLVITDWNMPVMGGLDLLRRLRAAPATARTPVLMVTTRGAKEDILAAMDAGVTGYILKPFTPEVLREKIDEIVSGQTESA